MISPKLLVFKSYMFNIYMYDQDLKLSYLTLEWLLVYEKENPEFKSDLERDVLH